MQRALLVLSVLAAGCGPGSYGELVDEVQKVWCDHEVACGVRGASQLGCALPPPSVLPGYGTVEIEQSIAEKRMHYDSLEAKDCVAALRSAPCDPTLFDLAVTQRCQTVVAPRAASGEACLDSQECIGGYCQTANNKCFGTCVAFGPIGTPCDDSTIGIYACDPTVHYCSDLAVGSRVCTARQPENKSCAADNQCLPDLVCVENKCKKLPRPTAGKPCLMAICKNDSYCGADLVCHARAASGEACDDLDGCKSKLACAGLSSAATTAGTCVEFSDEKGACTPGDATGCPRTMSCIDNTCVAAPVLTAGWGESCDALPCSDGLRCTGTGVCAVPLGAGGACGTDSTLCRKDLTCANGRCLPLTCMPPPL